MVRKSKPPEPPSAMASNDPRWPLLLNRLRGARAKVEEFARRDPELEDPDYDEWDQSVRRLLTDLFGGGSYLIRFRQLNVRPISYFVGGESQWNSEPRSAWQTGLSHAGRILDEALEETAAIEAHAEMQPAVKARTYIPTSAARARTNRAFIVHGHDDAARESVARFLEKLGVEAIILHEQATGGKTVVEKLEYYADVDFAIVLLTPDDIGAVRGTAPEGLQSRARQNVVLELGFFVGKLGRTQVCALHKGMLEMPSDYLGVVYVPLDDTGGWRLKLAKELRVAGFAVDMNLVV